LFKKSYKTLKISSPLLIIMLIPDILV